MNELNKLIKKLCPNGVEYKTIGEISSYRRGSFPQPYTNSSFYGGDGAMPFVQVADIEDTGFRLKEVTKQTISKIAQPKSIFVPKDTVICSIQGSIGRVAITQYDSYIDRTIAIFESFKININKKYFAYCIELKFGIEKEFARGSTLKTITKEEFTKFSIPVPPLDVQQKIVQILDELSFSTEELIIKLSNERNARRKQFNFYKDELYSFENRKIEYVRLGDIAEISRGGNFQKKDFVEDGLPCIHYGQIYTKYGSSANNTLTFVNKSIFDKSKQASTNDIVMAVTSENIEDVCKCLVWEGKEKVAISGHTAIIHHNINAKYLCYYFSTSHFFKQKRKLAHGTKVIEVTPDKLNDILIPLPDEIEQEKISRLIEKFEKVYNKITAKLDDEIEKRQKQYEYYRDKLLSFKEVEENV